MKIMPHDMPMRSKSRWAEIARANGVTRQQFWERTNRGWSERDAANVASNKHRRQDRERFRKIMDKTGLSYNTIYVRLRRGWTFEEIEAHPRPVTRRN